ncbi:MAG: hypothetical protein WC832_01960 [Anaerolineales bacterium]
MRKRPQPDLKTTCFLEYRTYIRRSANPLEADLRWLDMAEMRLEEVKGQPLPEPEIRPRGRPKKE